jgi:hypothetical protein
LAPSRGGQFVFEIRAAPVMPEAASAAVRLPRRVRTGHGAQNLSRLRRIALNLLKREPTEKASIANKRLLAGWDHDYLLRLLTA